MYCLSIHYCSAFKATLNLCGHNIYTYVYTARVICDVLVNSPIQVLVPSGIFDMDKLMAALAYQVDPQAVDVENYTMFRPRKKTGVLSSR